MFICRFAGPDLRGWGHPKAPQSAAKTPLLSAGCGGAVPSSSSQPTSRYHCWHYLELNARNAKIPGGFCALHPFPQHGEHGAGSLPVGVCTLQKSNSSTTVSEKKKVICKRGRGQGLGGDGAACTTANTAPWLLQGCAPSTPQPSQAPSCSQPFPESKQEVCASPLSFSQLCCFELQPSKAAGPWWPCPSCARHSPR